MNLAMDRAQLLPLMWRRLQHWWITGVFELPEAAQAEVSGSSMLPVYGPSGSLSPELERAIALVRAVDAGGLPLSPLLVNRIGRAVGLEVSSAAPMDETVERIRQQLLVMAEV